MNRSPFRLIPACKNYLWGGEKLITQYHKVCDKAPLAETWELSCHKDGSSMIADGPCAGTPLSVYMEKAGVQAAGTNSKEFEHFPVLVKLIDAKQPLSLQVHPADEYALRVEGEYGKTEMWYIVDCAQGAELVYGFDLELTKDEFRRRIEDNTLLDIVRRVPVHKGDVFFIEAGTLHAIGKDIVIAEIQQNSNTTYRVYDYGRRGADGKLRKLHIDKALDVTDLHPVRYANEHVYGETGDGWNCTRLSSCRYFTVDRYAVQQQVKLLAGEESFHHILCVEGAAALHCGTITLPLETGGSIFVPAGAGEYTVNGNCVLLLTTI